jgi:uncharacterized membrane protein YhiD involved in acid resistance
MKELTERFSLYFQNFAESIHPIDFIVNLIVATVLSSALAMFYIYFGNAISNRRRFAANFVPLALTTMLVMIIVKSSLALSLGLVGALSIVRFRAAIKDPEELTYLFLVIGIGLCTGANQPILALVLILFLFVFLYINKRASGEVGFRKDDSLFINVTTDINDLQQIVNVLKQHLMEVELKRMDAMGKNIGLDLSFVCKAKSIKEIAAAKDALLELSPTTTVSFIDKPDLIV